MSDAVDVVVIGAGVVGLAVARAFALQGHEVVVVERHGHIGEETSSRNSEVIHAGIYYPQGSLKARFCVEGKARLYAYCAERGITALRRGKLIVATSEAQIPRLRDIKAMGEANGVNDLVWLGAQAAQAMEPELACVAALHSPSTGVIDSHAYMLSLQGDAEAAGAMIAFGTEIEAIAAEGGEIIVEVGGAEPYSLRTRRLVNAAGLFAPKLAAALWPDRSRMAPPKGYLAKGNYFSLVGVRTPFSHLIYPVPEPGGLGIHVTVDLAGRARFGPDVEWVDEIDYAVDADRGTAFYASVRRYWPALPDGALQPDYAGMRAKIVGPGEPNADFLIAGPRLHGQAGVVHLLGIESPGLTASLAIADAVLAEMDAQTP